MAEPAAKRPRGRPAKSAAAPSRNDLLSCAMLHFANESYEQVSLRKLAAELGISDSLLHHHFGSKEQLWREAVDHAAAQMGDQVTELVAQKTDSNSALQRLQKTLEVGLQLNADQPELLRLTIQGDNGSAERSRILREKFLDPYLDQLAYLFARCRTEGSLAAHVCENTLFVLFLGAARVLIEAGILRERLAHTLANPASKKDYIDNAVATIMRGISR